MSDSGSQGETQPDPKNTGVEPTGDPLGTRLMGPSAFHRSKEEDPVECFFLWASARSAWL